MLKAVIFDLDGVITNTAALHRRAWKTLFDSFLLEQLPPQLPFDEITDYHTTVDGKPRYEGVASFLMSRNLSLPQGNQDDSPDSVTVCGLGNKKDILFNHILNEEGVEVFDDARELIDELSASQVPMAVASSSRNCRKVLNQVNLTHFFQVIVDGVVLDQRGLPGKPQPDIFLEASRELGLTPSDCVVIEDALSGVQAGRAGNFCVVVGLARDGAGEALRAAGADVVCSKLPRDGLSLWGKSLKRVSV